ncbi:MAG TPA: hypothetical protein VIL84_10335 [Devosiaceae bacterium]
MNEKKVARNADRERAQQVFRQFAWHLAGTLAGTKASRPATPQPRKPAAAKGARR